MEILYRDLVKRADCQEASYRDLARRSFLEILYRDLVQRAEVLLRDPVMEILRRQRPFTDADMRPTGVILQIFLSRCLSESFSRWRAHFPRLWKGFEIFSARDFSVTLLPRSLRCFLNEILLGCCCSFSLVGVRILAAGDGVRSIATCHSFGLCHASRAAEQLPRHRARCPYWCAFAPDTLRATQLRSLWIKSLQLHGSSSVPHHESPINGCLCFRF